MTKLRHYFLWLLLVALLAACDAAPAPIATREAAHTPAIITIAILHTNDIHGYVEPEKVKLPDGKEIETGGLANLAGTIDQTRKDYHGNVLLLDAGDVWRGTFLSNRTNGELLVTAMNISAYDAVSPGNHDFDDGQDVLKARVQQAKFPWLAANLVDVLTNQAPFGMKPYLVKQVAGVRFGIIGLTNPATPIINKPGNVNGLQFLPGADGVRRVYDEVRKQSDIIVVLSHLGIDGDGLLAQTVGGIDLIVGGHSHTQQINARLVNNTIITQAGSNARFLGRLELSIDPATKKITSAVTQNELLTITNAKYPANSEIADLVKNRLDVARATVNRPIGEAADDLIRAYTPDGRTSGEYPLGNLVMDAMLAANQAGDRPADIALHNNAGLRADIMKGPISYGKLYEVLPFDNVLTAMDLSGAQIAQILEQAVSCPRVNILVAGMSFAYDCAKPRGERVSAIVIRGQALDAQKIYRVQTIDYLAGGGDGQSTFRDGTSLVYGDLVVDVVAAYVQAHSPLHIQNEGRIRGR